MSKTGHPARNLVAHAPAATPAAGRAASGRKAPREPRRGAASGGAMPHGPALLVRNGCAPWPAPRRFGLAPPAGLPKPQPLTRRQRPLALRAYHARAPSGREHHSAASEHPRAARLGLFCCARALHCPRPPRPRPSPWTQPRPLKSAGPSLAPCVRRRGRGAQRFDHRCSDPSLDFVLAFVRVSVGARPARAPGAGGTGAAPPARPRPPAATCHRKASTCSHGCCAGAPAVEALWHFAACAI
ncbi:MAG: hypothetical protein J3K34DRAFT_49178 [Monoraphidium minutum]|nr:MAG: hypothetical protein J3K34DRAFT_49178 [Monoraphidium minutum]